MVAGREDDDLRVCDDVDKAVLVVHPPRPSAGQVGLQRLRFADAIGLQLNVSMFSIFQRPASWIAVTASMAPP